MSKHLFDDYREELENQYRVWQRKPSLRKLYHRWYARVIEALSSKRPVVEIGSGCGNFKEYFPECVATDISLTNNAIDRVVDAQNMPFGQDEVGNFVLIDALHHFPRPIKFLHDAANTLKPGGRIVIFEPAVTPFARLVWRYCHHEPVNMDQDMFAGDDQRMQEDGDGKFSNMGTATLLFVRGREEILRRLPTLRLVSVTYSDFLVYPATGGFSYFGFVPAFLLASLHRIEALLNRPFAAWLTGMRILVVLEKSTG